MAARHERALSIAKRAGAEAVLAADPATVTWLTGYGGSIETGPSPFGLPPLALLAPGEAPMLIVTEDEVPATEALGCGVTAYPGYSVGPLDPVGHAANALASAVDGRAVATEPGALPARLAAQLATTVDAAAELAAARAVKDPDEIERLRAVIALCDTGQRTARMSAMAGAAELDLFAALRSAMERQAGGRVPLLADLISGPRTAGVEGLPGTRVLEEGDLLIADLVPRLDGYWGDSCGTVAVGEPGSQVRERHAEVRTRLERAVEAVRPGVVAGDLDAVMRDGLGYPHHSGHGIGTSYHEEPRIVPGWPTVLEPGMVLALEPGWYGERDGIRLEWIVLVTKDGCEVLSRHDVHL